MDYMGTDDLMRIQTVPAIISKYNVIPKGSGNYMNERVMVWLNEYTQNLGWREGHERDRFRKIFKKEIKHKRKMGHLTIIEK